MKYLGLDYGTRSIGIAISDAVGIFAFPHSVIPADDQVFTRLIKLLAEEGIERIVMGDTRTSGDMANTITTAAEAFAHRLEHESGMSVKLAHEAWSSFEAARYAPGKHHDDSVAAAIILQRYLDMHASSNRVE